MRLLPRGWEADGEVPVTVTLENSLLRQSPPSKRRSNAGGDHQIHGDYDRHTPPGAAPSGAVLVYNYAEIGSIDARLPRRRRHLRLGVTTMSPAPANNAKSNDFTMRLSAVQTN